MSLTFDNPNALWLLVLVPVFYAVGRLGTAYLARPVRNAAILIRLMVVTALILSIARPVLHRQSDALSVVFVADRLSVAESNIAPQLDPAQLTQNASPAGKPAEHEIWYWVAGGALALLGAEWLIYFRRLGV